MELTPIFSVSFNGAADAIQNRVIAINTNDEAGFVSDSCEIELDNYDGALILPRTEAMFEVSLGYRETGLTKIGTYFVKEIAIDGAQKTIRIKGNAARKSVRSQKSRTNEGTLSQVFQTMASDSDLLPAFDDSFADIDLDYMPQFAESDMHYLTRIAQKIGAVAKPVDGHLVLTDDMQAKSVSGKTLPTKYIDMADISNYTCTFKETESSNGGGGTVYANWYDKTTGEYHLVHVGNGEPETELDEIFPDEKSALAAAGSRFKYVTKNNTVLRFNTSGRADLFAELPLTLLNPPKDLHANWIISMVQHSFRKNGFFSSLECKVR